MDSYRTFTGWEKTSDLPGYSAGYNDGYRAGLQKGRRQAAKRLARVVPEGTQTAAGGTSEAVLDPILEARIINAYKAAAKELFK